MALSDIGLVARYWFNEAASGSAPTQVDDDSGVGTAVPLAINYGSGNLQWTEVSGNRGLVSSSTTGGQRADKANILTAPAKLHSSMHGVTQASLVIVADVSGWSGSGGRLAGYNDAVGSNGLFILRGTGTGAVQVAWNDTIVRTFSMAAGRKVIHVVVDTTLATANDRVKVYVNGSLISPTVNANPVQNNTLNLSPGPTAQFVCLNRESDGSWDRSITGTLYYVAVHAAALTAGIAASDYADLIVDDDAPISAGPTYTLTLNTGAVALAGPDLGMSVSGGDFVLNTGALSLAGPDVGMTASRLLNLDVGALPLAGSDLDLARVIEFLTDALPLAGGDIDFSVITDKVLTLEAAGLSLAGGSIGLLRSSSLTLEPGTLSLDGADVGIVRNRVILLSPGSLPLAGGDLVWVMVVEFETGALPLTGGDVIFTVISDKVLSLETGVVELAGLAVPLNTSRLLTLDTGGMALAGQDINFTLFSASQLILGTGSLPLGGGALNFTATRRFALDTGVLDLTGFDIIFTWSGEPPPDYLNILELEVAIARRLEKVIKLARKLELEVKI